VTPGPRRLLFAFLLLLAACSDPASIGTGTGGDGQSPLLVLGLFLAALAIVLGVAALVRRRRSGPGDNP
jgi:LPXTG-motif cell wall-anchored protein